MSKLTVTMFVSLDSVVEEPHKWSLKYWNDEISKFKNDELFSSDEQFKSDALLLGRVTYEGFAAAWPGRKGSNPYSDLFNEMPKFVASKTLRDPEWSNSTVLGPDTVAEVSKLKHDHNLLVFGSIQLVNSLMPHGLIDEYRLLTYPLVLGSGKRFFLDGSKAALNLIETRPMGSGVVLSRYEPANP